MLEYFSKSVFIVVLVAVIFIMSPIQVKTDLSFPATPCDYLNAVPDYHFSNLSTQEDGTIAFKYGADNNSFVSVSGDIITFHIQTFLPAESAQPHYPQDLQA